MDSTRHEEYVKIKQAKNNIYIIIIIFLTPLMVCDLYYGFSGDECLDEYPEQIHLNLKKYLIGCGFMTIINMIYMIIITSLISQNVDMNTIIMIISSGISFIIGVIMLVWNIIGAVIFWQFIFPEHSCNESLSNYLFVSIIIKLVLTWASFHKSSEYD